QPAPRDRGPRCRGARGDDDPGRPVANGRVGREHAVRRPGAGNGRELSRERAIVRVGPAGGRGRAITLGPPGDLDTTRAPSVSSCCVAAPPRVARPKMTGGSSIIAELRAIQRAHGFIPVTALRDLSERARVPLYQLHGVVSFFPHFRESPAPPVEVLVCDDMSCHRRGASALLAALEE